MSVKLLSPETSRLLFKIGNHLKSNFNIRGSPMSPAGDLRKMSSGDQLESCKQKAAYSAVNLNINADTSVVGVGSGSTIYYVVKRIAELSQSSKCSVRCIPTSFQSKQLIHDFGLELTDLDRDPQPDVTIDGADEVDENYVAIKGGGACHAQEKIIASASKKFVVVADYTKNSKFLGQNWKKGIPIEVLPIACNSVRRKLTSLDLSKLCLNFEIKSNDLKLRISNGKAGPVITDNGNMIIDWHFNCDMTSHLKGHDWAKLADAIKLVPGVIETGLFANMVDELHFGHQDRDVEFIECK